MSSSYWPVFTLHIKPAKNNAATVMLANNKMMITLIMTFRIQNYFIALACTMTYNKAQYDFCHKSVIEQRRLPKQPSLCKQNSKRVFR